MKMNKHKKCLVCQSYRLKKMPLSYYKLHELVKCKDCGFIFMENIPSTKELNKLYSKYSYSTERAISPITVKSYNLLLDEFEKYRKTNKILDVGCGRGWFLQEAKKRGWEVYGTEYSMKAKEICEGNGIDIHLGKLKFDTFIEDSFDVITSFEVIEHINNPVDDASCIYSFLRKGGLFYCTTPNFNALLRFYLKENYNIITYPEHLAYYTNKSLQKLLISVGFKKVKILSTGISISRLKDSLNSNPNIVVSNRITDDEKLRQQINQKLYLRLIKKLVNKLFTFFRLGLTIKGYFVK